MSEIASPRTLTRVGSFENRLIRSGLDAFVKRITGPYLVESSLLTTAASRMRWLQKEKVSCLSREQKAERKEKL